MTGPAGLVSEVCVPSTPEVEAGGLSVRLPGLHGMFKASLGSIERHCFRTNMNSAWPVRYRCFTGVSDSSGSCSSCS